MLPIGATVSAFGTWSGSHGAIVAPPSPLPGSFVVARRGRARGARRQAGRADVDDGLRRRRVRDDGARRRPVLDRRRGSCRRSDSERRARRDVPTNRCCVQSARSEHETAGQSDDLARVAAVPRGVGRDQRCGLPVTCRRRQGGESDQCRGSSPAIIGMIGGVGLAPASSRCCSGTAAAPARGRPSLARAHSDAAPEDGQMMVATGVVRCERPLISTARRRAVRGLRLSDVRALDGGHHERSARPIYWGYAAQPFSIDSPTRSYPIPRRDPDRRPADAAQRRGRHDAGSELLPGDRLGNRRFPEARRAGPRSSTASSTRRRPARGGISASTTTSRPTSSSAALRGTGHRHRRDGLGDWPVVGAARVRDGSLARLVGGSGRGLRGRPRGARRSCWTCRRRRASPLTSAVISLAFAVGVRVLPRHRIILPNVRN